MKQKILREQLDDLNKVGLKKYWDIWEKKQKYPADLHKYHLLAIGEMVEFISNTLDGWDKLDKLLAKADPSEQYGPIGWCDALWGECVKILNKEEDV